jgi:hypothetical protein
VLGEVKDGLIWLAVSLNPELAAAALNGTGERLGAGGEDWREGRGGSGVKRAAATAWSEEG